MFTCNVCKGKTFDDSDAYVNHLISEEHIKLNTEPVLDFACDICGKKLSGITPYNQHLKSKKHNKKVEQLKLQNSLKNTGACSEKLNNASQNNLNGLLPTNTCYSNSSENMEQNEDTNVGMPSVIQKQMWSCSICQKLFTDHTLFNEHFNGDDHNNNQQKCETLKTKLQYGNTSINVDFSKVQGSSLEVEREHLLQDINMEYVHSLNDTDCDMVLCSQANSIGNTLSESMETTSNNQSTEFFCELCKVPCTGFIPYTEHMASKKHKKEQEKQEMLQKIINNKSERMLKTSLTLPNKQEGANFSSENKTTLVNHLMDESSSNVICESSLSEDFDYDSISSNLPAFASTMICTTCNVPCSGVIPYQQHMSSQKHAKEVEKKKMYEKIMKNMSSPSGIEYFDDEKKKIEPEHSGINLSANSVLLEESQTNKMSNDLISFDETSSSSESCTNLSTDEAVSSTSTFHCDVCNIDCTGIVPYAQHRSSAKHMKVIEKKKLLEKHSKNKLNFSQTNVEHHIDTTEVKHLTDNMNSVDVSQIPNHQDPDKSSLQLSPPSKSLINSSESSISSHEVVRCHVCEVNCSGLIPYEQHLHSQKHTKMLERKKVLQKLSNSYSEEQQVNENKSPKCCSDVESFLDNSDDSLNSTLNSQGSWTSDSNDSEALPSYIWKCTVCKTSFSGIIPYTQHMTSNRHRRQLEKDELLQRFQEKKNLDILSPEHNYVSHESAICRRVDVYTDSETVFSNGTEVEESSKKMQCAAMFTRSNSEMEDSVIVIELGCDQCGIDEFVNEAARNEHLQTKEHLEADSMKNYEVDSE